MKNQNSPEVIKVNDQNFGSHGEHWNLLTSHPETDVPKWLGLALDAPVMPMGLCEHEEDMDQSFGSFKVLKTKKLRSIKLLLLKTKNLARLKQPSQVSKVHINIMRKLNASLLATLLHKLC